MNGHRDITEFLKDTGTDLFYKGVAIPLAVNLGRIFYVNPFGNDATGTMGRIDRPYKTIQAACNATALYTSGDIVEVMTGTYTENVTSIVSTGINLILRGATVNGNINVNNNTNTGRLFLLQGSVVNGNILGTFGSTTLSDGSGVINGRIGTVGDNGGHWVKGLAKLSNTGDINAALYPNCTLEDIGTITTDYLYNFQFPDNSDVNANQRNSIIRRIGLIRNTSANATARIFQPNSGLYIDTLQNVDLILCDNGYIYNDIFRQAILYRCENVTFKSKLKNFYTIALSGTFNNCKFISTDEMNIMSYDNQYANGNARFYNCQFQAGAAATENFATHANEPNIAYVEILNCQYNKATLMEGAAPATLITGFNTYIQTLTIRTLRLI